MTLAALKEMLARATNGKWFNDHGKIGTTDDECGIGELDYSDDGELIANLRNAAPALIACAEVLGDYLDWGAMTGSDVELFRRRFEECLKILEEA